MNYYPLVKLSNGKKKIIFKDSYKVDSKREFERIHYLSNIYKEKYKYGDFLSFVNVPCGQCSECLRKKAKDTALRLFYESKNYKHNFFITLTYNDESLVLNDKKLPTLRKKDISDFNKKLKVYLKRRNLDSTFKFYGCGEYGDSTYRPHYHVIYFNLPLFDLKFYKVSDGHIYYNSDFLSNIWKKGHVVISEATQANICYVSHYVDKKRIYNRDEKLEIRSKYNIEPEFQFGSKFLGINLLDNIVEKIENNEFRYYVNGYSYSIPKYILNYLSDDLREYIISNYSKNIGYVQSNLNLRLLDNVDSLESLINNIEHFKTRELKKYF